MSGESDLKCTDCKGEIKGKMAENAWKFREPLCFKCYIARKEAFRKELAK